VNETRTVASYSSDLFDHDVNRKELLVEMSMLQHERADAPVFSMLYTDARSNEGLEIVSVVSGKTARFYVSDIEENDGDILSWTLLPTLETRDQTPNMKDYRVVIFNT
jgi:hypothetical protein